MVEIGPGTAPSLLDSANAGTWRAIGLAGGVGLALGLIVGVPIGRATVDSSVHGTVEATAPPAPLQNVPSTPEPVPQAYRASFLHRMPKGVTGLRRETADGRRSAKLDGNGAKLRVALNPIEGEGYALNAILRVDGAQPAKVQTSWDGQPLGTWEVSNRWTLMSLPLSASALSGEKHELILAADRVPADSAVRFDSLAVTPMSDDLHFSAATESVGHLIEGFSIPEARFVWSNGKRSVLGAVLAPAAGSYELTVRGSAYAHIAPIRVQLSVNARKLGAATVSKKTENIVWKIPPNVLQDGVNQMEFEYSSTGQPSQIKPGSNDDRELAMRFVSVNLAPID